MGMLTRRNWAKAELIERCQIVISGDTRFGPGHDGSVYGTRQALLGASLGDSNGFEPRISHAQSLGAEPASRHYPPDQLVKTDLFHAGVRVCQRAALALQAVELAKQTWTIVDVTSTLLIPLGSTEQHGPHLPVDTDARIAEAVAQGVAAARTGITVAPTLPYGASGEHAGFAGTLSIGTEALQVVIVELVRSARLTFERVVLVNGHGGNHQAVTSAVAQLVAEGHNVTAWFPSIPGGDAHAGRTETSLMLAIAPRSVRLDVAELGNTAPLAELLDELRTGGVAAASPNGVLGDPTGATAPEGHDLLQGLVADLMTTLT